MRHRVGKPPLGAFTRPHYHMARHGKEPVEPLADSKAFSMAHEHLGNTPHCYLAPGIFPGGIKLPVSEEVARCGIGDVIGRHRKFVDGH